jgi:hypothetical protein
VIDQSNVLERIVAVGMSILRRGAQVRLIGYLLRLAVAVRLAFSAAGTFRLE